MVLGPNWWFSPWRGKKAVALPSTSPIAIGGTRHPVRRVDDDTIATLVKEGVKPAPSDYGYVRIQLSQLLVMAQFAPFRRGNFSEINRSSVYVHGNQREQ